MLPIPGETILYGAVDADFVITSHRIRANSKSWGQAHLISIMLEELSSASLKYTSHPLLFVVAFFAFVAGGITSVFTHTPNTNLGTLLKFAPLCTGGVVAVGLVLLYFITRQLVLVFASAGASITLDAMRLGLATTRDLIDTVEIAKNYRYFQAEAFTPEMQPVEN